MARRRIRRGRARAGALLVLAAAVLLTGCEQRPLGPTPRVKRTAGKLTMSNSKAGSAILRVGNMKPGHAYASDVTVTNTGSLPGAFFLSASNFQDAPGPRGGRLSDRLTLDVQETSRGGKPTLVYSGPLQGLDKTPLGTLIPWALRTYRFTVHVGDPTPGATPTDENSYQNASVQVDYDWTATAVAPLRLTISVPGKQRVLRGPSIALKAGCDRPCTVTAAATLPVRRGRRPTQLGTSRLALRAVKSTKLAIRLSRKALAAIEKAAPGGRAAKVTVTVDARDPSGLTATAKRVIKIYGSRR